MPKPDAESTSNRVLKYLEKALLVLVIPLLLWGIKLEVGIAVRDEKLAKLQIEVDKALRIELTVQGNSLKLAVMEGKIDTTNAKLEGLHELLTR